MAIRKSYHLPYSEAVMNSRRTRYLRTVRMCTVESPVSTYLLATIAAAVCFVLPFVLL